MVLQQQQKYTANSKSIEIDKQLDYPRRKHYEAKK